MSTAFHLFNLIIDSQGSMTSTEKLVMLTLLRHRNRKSGRCFPSVKTLADKTGFTSRTVQKAIRSLEARELIVISAESGKSNQYILSLADGEIEGLSDEYEEDTPLNEVHPTPERGSPHLRTCDTLTVKGTVKVTDTVPKGTDAEASKPSEIDLPKLVFDTGVQILGEAGIVNGKARSQVGKWRKAATDGELLAAFSQAQKERAADPVAYITACLKPKSNGWRPKQSEEFSRYGEYIPWD